MATFPLADIMTGSRTLNVEAVGTAADNAAASGNPVRVAAKYNSATQTYSDGDTADLQADVSGNLKTVLMGRKTQVITLFNALAITDITAVTKDLITDGSMTQDEIRQYTDFTVSVYDTHANASANAIADLRIYAPVLASSPTNNVEAGELYNNATAIGNGAVWLCFTSAAGGTGADVIAVPAFKSLLSNIIIRVKFAAAPDSGALTIKIEMRR